MCLDGIFDFAYLPFPIYNDSSAVLFNNIYE